MEAALLQTCTDVAAIAFPEIQGLPLPDWIGMRAPMSPPSGGEPQTLDVLINGRLGPSQLLADLDTGQTIGAVHRKGQLLASVAGELVGIVDPMRAAGGLYENYDADGNLVDPGYSVDVGPTVNTVAVLNANKIAAVLALRVSPVGTLIDLTIVKAGLTATV